jgi:DNA-binding response OmpR family regulator
MRQGAKDYLVKPLNERVLLDKIRLLVLDGRATATMH